MPKKTPTTEEKKTAAAPAEGVEKSAAKKADAPKGTDAKAAPAAKSSKIKAEAGILYVQSTYNNTKLILTDLNGNALCWSSSGSLGFKGAKKGTPFAAAKVGETLA